MSAEHDALLMRYHDDELEADELGELEQRLAEDAEAQAVLGGLEQLGDVLRALSDARSAPAGDIADSVMARIDAEPLAEQSAPASGREPVRRWSFPAVAAALAAAASLLVWVSRPADDDRAPPMPVAHTTAPMVAPPAPAPVVEPEPQIQPEELQPAVAIESVDFGPRNGAIFMVSAGAETTPVVWLADEGAQSADPTESP